MQWSVSSPAWAVEEPANDAIVPSDNWKTRCIPGLADATYCQTDNNVVSYYMDSSGEFALEAEDRADVQGAIARYNATILSISYDSSPTFSGGGETDVVYQEGPFGAPDFVSGVTWCNDAVDTATYKCDQQYIRMRGAGRINPIVATHETGHAFGLMHGRWWAPERLPCESIVGIMREAEDCIGSPALGTAVTNNVHWVYR